MKKTFWGSFFKTIFVFAFVFMTFFAVQSKAEEKVPTELGFLYHCNAEEFLEWNSNFGYFD